MRVRWEIGIVVAVLAAFWFFAREPDDLAFLREHGLREVQHTFEVDLGLSHVFEDLGRQGWTQESRGSMVSPGGRRVSFMRYTQDGWTRLRVE